MAGSDPNLTALAGVEEELAALRLECTRLPHLVDEEETAASGARARIEAARAELAAAEKQRRGAEARLQDLEQQRSKFQAQSAMVKTNAEYTALLGEIDGTTARISHTEDEILTLMDDIERAQRALAETERTQSAVERTHAQQAHLHRERLAQAQARIAELEKERDALVPLLGSAVERVYARVAARGGTPVARVRGGSCSACHRAVPPETVNRVRAGELRTCQNCLAILVAGIDP
jgi:predicted  nucleic acid-binding Zn-ribbon protein